MATNLTITAEFQRSLDLLHQGANLFLTGKAGTGKSTLIRHFLQTTDRRAITVAPTGIAALNVEGYTIHRLFSFPIGVNLEMIRSGSYYPARFAKTLANLDTLVVDEASMVRADLFDAMAAALERFGPRPGAPFGGVQLVLVGDLYQLPPVVADAESAYIESQYGTPFFFSAHSFDRDRFPIVELTTVFRQVGDPHLVDLLNAVRDGTLLADARAELNTRTDPDFEPDLDEFWLTLATTNRIVKSRNRRMLQRLPNPPMTFEAALSGELDGFEFPTERSLELAIGAQVMLLNNDPADRWVNGTLGRIVDLFSDRDGPLVQVQMQDGRIEQVRAHRWEITRPVVHGGALSHEVVGSFSQLPMKLAWAITIHKSQGQTLDRVIVDLTGGTFANGQLYVALSRCTSLKGLVLRRDVLPRDLKADSRIRRFLTQADPDSAAGEVYLAALTVGTIGERYRPRPIEIAIVTDDGDEATTVVNPTCDLYSAQSDFQITTRDVQLAPVLTEAWAALSPLLAGRVPVGLRIDELLAVIDFELKRCGVVEPMPLGIEIPAAALKPRDKAKLAAPTALERARALRDVAARLKGGLGDGTTFHAQPRGVGYLLARTTGPSGTTSPSGAIVGGNLSAEDDPAQVLADALKGAWDRVVDKDQTVVDRLRGIEQYFGVEILPPDVTIAAPIDIHDLLCTGAHVCFTGTVLSATFGSFDREEMEQIACQRGLIPVNSVTKKRTDVLVVAERGTQSNKAKKAAAWGKPVLSAEEFLAWALES